MNINNLIYFQILIFITLAFVSAQRAQRARSRLCSIVSVPNAFVRFKHNNKIMRINCVTGFTLQGSNIVGCENGKWNAEIPVCTKEGCSKPDSPINGLVMPTRFKANLYCKENYKLVGGRVAYCNGTHWDRPLGKCQETDDKIQLACDFESDDLCGWSHDGTHNFDWRRVMAANLFQLLRTGPQHDHTTLTANAGHYMLMESFNQAPHSVARLVSPIYTKELTNIYGCFKFFYFMYGAAVGSLNIYVKPVSVDIEQMLQEPRYKHFGISGNQNNMWKEALFIIKQSPEDFQIIIEGSAGINHLSDIAIDDVQILPYFECATLGETGITKLPEFSDFAIYDVQSCEGRCSETNSSNFKITNREGVFFKSCDCYEDCEILNTCCPNYRALCEFGNTETSTESFETKTLPYSMNYTNLLETTFTTSLVPTKNSTPILDLSQTNVVSLSTQTTKLDENISEVSTLTTQTMKVEPDIEITLTSRRVTESFSTLASMDSSTENLKTTSAEQLITRSITLKSELNRTLENDLLRKDKFITWKMSSSTKRQKQDSSLLILILILIVTAIAIVGVAFKYHDLIKRIKQRHLNRLRKEHYGDTTVLIYNQNNDPIVKI